MVTGASSGISWEVCLDLASAGYKIITAALRADRLQSLYNQIDQSQTPRAVAVELDVSADSHSIETAAKKAWNAFRTIDVLIKNAGVRGTVKSALVLPEEEWNSTIWSLVLPEEQFNHSQLIRASSGHQLLTNIDLRHLYL